MNIEICKNCKFRYYIIYRKYFDHDKNNIVEETSCLNYNDIISAIPINDLICMYIYYINLHKWKLNYIKIGVDKLSDNELYEKLKLNKEYSEFNLCPFKTEHKLHDLISKK